MSGARPRVWIMVKLITGAIFRLFEIFDMAQLFKVSVKSEDFYSCFAFGMAYF